MLEKAVLYKIRIGKITLAAWAAQVVAGGGGSGCVPLIGDGQIYRFI